MTSKTNHLWGGRFNEPTDKLGQKIVETVSFEEDLALYDIE